MSARVPVPTETETLVLVASARRCALCFCLDGNLERTAGQIAHIDRNPSNADERNLVYLCLNHHNEYDSKTSQSKGFTEGEMRAYKAKLIAAIANGDHLRPARPPAPVANNADPIRVHDEQLFRRGDELAPETFLREFLYEIESDDSFRRSQVGRLDRFSRAFTETGNQFITPDLSEKLRVFTVSIDVLLGFLATHFFIYPKEQSTTDDVRFCMYPDLNIDRGGPGTRESMARYDRFQTDLHNTAGAVLKAYAEYRSAVKRHLYV